MSTVLLVIGAIYTLITVAGFARESPATRQFGRLPENSICRFWRGGGGDLIMGPMGDRDPPRRQCGKRVFCGHDRNGRQSPTCRSEGVLGERLVAAPGR